MAEAAVAYSFDRVFGLVVEHPPLTRKARVRFPLRRSHTKDFKKWNLLPLWVMLRISNGVGKTSHRVAKLPAIAGIPAFARLSVWLRPHTLLPSPIESKAEADVPARPGLSPDVKNTEQTFILLYFASPMMHTTVFCKPYDVCTFV